MHPTLNSLSEKIRADIVEVLNASLADAIDLTLQGKQAHWNVKGPHFMALHELFDKIVEESEGWVDDIAERAVALGGVALGTLQRVQKHSRLRPYPTDIFEGVDHVQAYAEALAAFGNSTRQAIDETARLGDAGTSDLFTGISRAVDKALWFVEAHRQTRK
jgi:starvation-inducible DNA-binding protein